MDKEYRLQILRHNEPFESREAAMKYVEKYLTPDVLIGEPALVTYESGTDTPNAILVFGVADREVFAIDFANLTEQLATLEESESGNEEQIEALKEAVSCIVKACGLTYDDNKKTDQITYEPDNKDELIGEAETLAQAVDIISKYVQGVAEESVFEVEDSDSVMLHKEESADGKTLLKAYVKISELGDTSLYGGDDNIIGTFSDGLYAVAHLSYDEETKKLTFITSGYDSNGEFKRDANKEVISFGEHTLYEGYNKGHNVEVVVDNDEMQISADVKISDNDNNILESKSDGLLVTGNASNIKYHNTTVREAINDLYDKVTDAAKKTEYNDSDTVKFTTTTDSNDELNVTADVKLASNNSINVTNGGLNVNLEISIDAASNTLTVKLGDTEHVYDLPDAKIIDHIEFKDGDLILWYDGDRYVTIPTEGLVAHYVFENDNEHFVHLDADLDSDGIYHVYATVKLRSSDNLINHNSSGELFVSKEEIESIVSGISDDIIERVAALETKVSDLETANVGIVKDIEQLQKDVETNTANISSNTEAINAIQTQMAADETSLKAIQAQVETNITNIQANADAISALQSEVKDVEAEIKLDEQTLENLTNEVKSVEDTVSEVQTEVSTNTYNITLLTTKTEEIQSEIDTLNGDADTVGSVEHTVKVAKDIVEEELSTETTRATNAEDNLQTQIDNLSAQISGDEESILASAKEYTDSQVEKVQTALDSEVDRATAAEEALQDSVDTINDKIDSIKIEKVDGSNLKYELLVDGKNAGYINIPEDAFLKSVYYDESLKALVFDFLVKTDDGGTEEQVVTIPISDMVSDYTQGDGISISDNQISVKLNNDANTEGYLKLGEGGLYVSGVDSAIESAVNSASENLQSQIDETNAAIDIINGGSDTEGSIKNAIATSEAYTDEKVSELESQISEVANEICDAGDGLKKIDVEGGHKFDVHINSNSQSYLTVDEDGLNLSGVADAETLNSVDSRVSEIERDYVKSADIADFATKEALDETNSNVSANTSAINDLSNSVDGLKFTTVDTSTVELAMKEGSGGRELSAKAVISNAANNNIVDNGGLYSVSDFNYNAATNVITFTNSNGSQEFTINTAGSLVVGAYYDSTNHAIVLILSDGAGETHEISIPISDLIYDIEVDNGTSNPIQLKLAIDAPNGVKIISASLQISSDGDNLINNNNGELFASNEAKDHYCTAGDGTQKSVQQVITEYYNEFTSVNNTINNLEKELSDTSSSLDDVKEQVNENTSNITVLQGQVSTLEENFENLSTELDSVQEQVQSISDDLNSLKECLGDICGDETVAERLANIEEIVNKLIDFGYFEDERN